MKELIVWIEVDVKDEADVIAAFHFRKGAQKGEVFNAYFKRVVKPILSNQEIEDKAVRYALDFNNHECETDFINIKENAKTDYAEGYKACQLELINNSKPIDL